MSQDTASLVIEPREVTGKAVKHLRSAGQVPVVIHDHGKDSVIAQADAVALLKIWKQAGKHHSVDLKLGSKSYTAMIKEAEFDPQKHVLRHVVFNAVSATQKVAAEVPIHAKYAEGNESSPAERAGLMVLVHADSIMVESIASKLPDTLYYDAEKLVAVGDTASVGDVVVPEGVIIKTDPSQSIASVVEPSAVQAANDVAGGDAEEVAPEASSEEGDAPAAEASEKPAE
jgi:large subunit ribosomal protein L25